MKKILIVALLCLLILPVSSAFAADTNIVAGKVFSKNGDPNTTYPYLTDGDVTTGHTITTGLNPTYYFTDGPYDINKVDVTLTGTLTMNFYNASGANIGSIVLSGNRSETISVKGVTRIFLTSTGAYTMKEISVYGVKSTGDSGTSSLLSGKPLIYGRIYGQNMGSISTLTDGIIDTTKSIRLTTLSGTGTSEPIGVSYTFDTNVDVDSLMVKASNDMSFMFYFVDGSVQSKTIYAAQTDGNKVLLSPPMKNVKGVFIKNGTSNQLVSLIEVDLYGQVTPIVNTDESLFVINHLAYTVSSGNSIALKWDAINSTFFKTYRVYQGSKLIGETKNTSYAMSSLEPGQTYSFKVTSVDVNGKEFPGSTINYTVPIPDVTPPAVPSNIKVNPDQYTASVTWDRVTDPDLLGYFVYLNGERANTTPVYTNSFSLSGLKAFTDYKVQIAAVDQAWNVSELSAAVEFKTLELDSPPDPPTGLQVVPFDGSVSLSWMPSRKAQSYKVYQDNQFLVKTDATSLKIKSLENGKTYSYQVSAVNDLGESDKSNLVTVMPDKTLLPDVALGYSLKDVSTGASHWFGSFWYILAFAIAIPLAFWISREIKGLFGGAR